MGYGTHENGLVTAMMKHKLSVLVGSVIAVMGAAYLGLSLYSEINLLPTVERTNLDGLRRDLLREDANLKRLVLESRYGMSQHYDELMLSSKNMLRLTRRWAYGVRRVASMVSEDVDPSLVMDAVSTQAKRAEVFKGRNARLRNSFRYLPRASDELRAITAKGARDFRRLQDAADAVVRSIFMLAAFRSGEDIQRVTEAIDVLKSEHERLRDQKLPRHRPNRLAQWRGLALARAKVVEVHASLCARVIPLVGQQLAAIVKAQISAQVAALDDQYNGFVQRIDAQAQRLQAGVFILTVLLTVLLVVFGVFLRRLYTSLEQKVAERTDSLQTLYQSNRVVLENVGEGLVTTTLGGVVSSEMSVAAVRWFGELRPADSVFTWFGRSDEEFGEYLFFGFEELLDDIMPQELVLAQFPSRLHLDRGSYDVGYTVMDRGPTTLSTRLLLTFTDVTDRLEREVEERRMSEIIALVRELGRDRRGTLEFMDDASSLVDSLSPQMDPIVAQRVIHTLKGNASTFGISAFASRCHDIEDRLDEKGERLQAVDIERLRDDWQRVQAEVSVFISDPWSQTLDVSEADIAELKMGLSSGASASDMVALVDTWSLERLSVRLERAGDVLRDAAVRMGKPEPEVLIHHGGIRLHASRWRNFWSAFVHVLRNTVDHGLEGAEERRMLDKPEQGLVELRAERVDGVLRLQVKDDGRGVDWERVATKARSMGLPAATPAELSTAIFTDGLSTRDSSSVTSGRGVGMAVVREATHQLRGEVILSSEPGRGTMLEFEFPESALTEDSLAA